MLSVAAPNGPLLPGHYTRTTGGNGFPAVDITDAASGASIVSMQGNVAPPQCPGSIDVELQYTIPLGYNGKAVNYTSGTCTGASKCPGLVVTCIGLGPAPAVFTQPRQDVVTASSPFWGGIASFSRASLQSDVVAGAQTNQTLQYRVIKSSGREQTIIVTGLTSSSDPPTRDDLNAPKHY